MSQNPNEKLDLLWGANAIAECLGVSKRQVFYQLEMGYLPARRIGARWVVSRAALDEFMCCLA